MADIREVLKHAADDKDKLLQTLKQFQRLHKMEDDAFQKGYYNGFEDGCNAMLKFISGNVTNTQISATPNRPQNL